MCVYLRSTVVYWKRYNIQNSSKFTHWAMFITLVYACDCGGSRRARLRETDEFMNGSTALQNCISVTTLSFPYKKDLLI